MRIAFVIGEVDSGAGQTRNLIEIIRTIQLYDKSWKITVFTHRYRDNVFPAGINVVMLTKYFLSLIGDDFLTTELLNYDICYIKGVINYVRPALRSGIPVILVSHHIDSPMIFPGVIPKIKVFLGNIMLPNVMKMVRYNITVTKELQNFYLKRYGISTTVIEDQISEIFFARDGSKSLNKNGLIKLLTVGSWGGIRSRKRQHILLECLRRAEALKAHIQLTLAGLFPNEIELLRNYASNLGIEDICIFKGKLSQQELLEEYKNNDIYVTATTYEGFYRQAVEAMAMGLPILAYDSRVVISDISQCASANHVLNSGAGRLFVNEDDFQIGLEQILENYNELSQLGKKYAASFNPSVIGQKTIRYLIKVYEDNF